MSRNNIEDIHPLSPMQQGILFHALFSGDPGAYVMESASTLRGALDAPAFVRAFQAVVARHPSLRSSFVWEKLDQPMQVVWRRVPLPVEQEDLRGLSAGEQTARVARFLEVERGKGFDLGRAPLMRLALLRLRDDEHRFVWTAHHLLLDGWSSAIVLKEVFALYDAEVSGKALKLDPVAAYGELIGWLQKQDRARAEAFFKKELQGFTEPTPLGVDRPPGGEVPSPRFGERQVFFTEEQSARLTAFARTHKLTPGTVLQGAWALLLSRYSGRDDVVFGAVLSGRSAPIAGIERMVGVFINTLPVRVSLPRAETVLAWLQSLQERQAEQREHEHTSLAEVQGLSEVPRGTPLFESLFLFENYPVDPSLGRAAAGLRVSDARGHEQPAYPLTVAGVFRRTLMVQIAYERARFDDTAIERMLAHLRTLLDALIEGPARALGELSLLSPEERTALLVTWNSTAVVYPPASLHALIEAQVDRSPQAVAVIFDGKEVSFRALDERANRLARLLRGHGVGPGRIVGVCVERSIELLVALLAVLKAGGAYVPIDPSYPSERVALMARESRAALILTQRTLRSSLPEISALVIVLDEEGAIPEGLSGDRLSDVAGPEDLAYVIYTSG
ncbi:MAG: condensation domain-containing protein, partial [Minicystis sp.]